MASMTDFEHIAYAVADRVATITLNRPDQLNAFTPTMMPSWSRRSTPPTPTTASGRSS